MAYSYVTGYDAVDINNTTTVVASSVVYANGETVFLGVTYGSAGGVRIVESISDGGTNTYAYIGTQADTTNGQCIAVFVVKNAVAGTYTVTFTLASVATFKGLGIRRYTGLNNTGTPQFIGNPQNNVPTTPNAITSTNITPSAQPAILFSFTQETSGNGAATATASGTFNSRGAFATWNTSISNTMTEDLRLTSTAAVAATFTAGNASNTFTTIAVVYPEAGVGGATIEGSRRTRGLIHPGRHPDRFGKRLKTRRFNTAPALSTLTGTAAVQSQGDAAASSGSPVISGTATPASKSDAVSASSQTVISGTGAVISKGDSESASGYAVVPVPSRIARRTQHPAIRGPYNPIRLRRTVNTTPPAAPTITGSAAILSGGDRVSASGAPTVSGTAAARAAGDADTASGTPSITGTATVTAQADKAAAAGSPVVSGSAAVKDAGDIAIASQNAAPVTGTAAILSQGDSGSAAGSPIISGNAAIIPKADSAAAVVSLLITGFGSVLNAGDLAAASGTLKVTGTAAAASQGDASDASGTFPVTGTAAVRSGNDFTFFPPNTGTVFSNYEEFLEDD